MKGGGAWEETRTIMKKGLDKETRSPTTLEKENTGKQTVGKKNESKTTGRKKKFRFLPKDKKFPTTPPNQTKTGGGRPQKKDIRGKMWGGGGGGEKKPKEGNQRLFAKTWLRGNGGKGVVGRVGPNQGVKRKKRGVGSTGHRLGHRHTLTGPGGWERGGTPNGGKGVKNLESQKTRFCKGGVGAQKEGKTKNTSYKTQFLGESRKGKKRKPNPGGGGDKKRKGHGGRDIKTGSTLKQQKDEGSGLTTQPM